MKFEQNTKGRDFIIGDLHGHLNLLNEKLAEVNFDKSVDRLFSTGDLIDRGPQSLECLKLVLEPWFFSVRGNHEQMMFAAILQNSGRDWNLWQYNGGEWINELDISMVEGMIERAERLMPFWMEVETENSVIGIVHAQPPEDWCDIELIDNYTLIWSREKISRQTEDLVENIRKVYVGHTPLKEAVTLGNVRYIDTGAFYTGNLTLEELK